MGRGGEFGALLRFVAGCSASLLAGAFLFHARIFEPDSAWFQCLTVGALLAGVLALTRIGRPGQALLLAISYTLVQIGYAWTQGWRRALAETVASAVVAAGAVVVAQIFDLLDRDGYRFGKFALLGPLLAGVFLASATLTLVGLSPADDVFGLLVRQVFVGLVVGDSVGLGVELVELVPVFRPKATQIPEA